MKKLVSKLSKVYAILIVVNIVITLISVLIIMLPSNYTGLFLDILWVQWILIMLASIAIKNESNLMKMVENSFHALVMVALSVSLVSHVGNNSVHVSNKDIKIETITKPKNETWIVTTNKTPVGATGELEVYSGSTLSEPKATPLEVTYKDRAGEVDRVVKYKRVSTRTTIFGSSKTEETVYKLK